MDITGNRPALIGNGLVLIVVGVLLLWFRDEVERFWERIFGEHEALGRKWGGPIFLIVMGAATLWSGVFS